MGEENKLARLKPLIVLWKAQLQFLTVGQSFFTAA